MIIGLLILNAEVAESVFGCVCLQDAPSNTSAFHIFSCRHTRQLFGSPYLNLGFMSGRASPLPFSFPECGQHGSFWPLFKKSSTRPHNQNKSTTRAFPAAMTSRRPSPSPSRVNRKRETKTSVSARLRAFRLRSYVAKCDIFAF